jgi:hypothetical protein
VRQHTCFDHSPWLQHTHAAVFLKNQIHKTQSILHDIIIIGWLLERLKRYDIKSQSHLSDDLIFLISVKNIDLIKKKH